MEEDKTTEATKLAAPEVGNPTPCVASASRVSNIKFGDKPIVGSFETPDRSDSASRWKKVAIAGVSCIVLGTGIAWSLNELLGDDEKQDAADDKPIDEELKTEVGGYVDNDAVAPAEEDNMPVDDSASIPAPEVAPVAEMPDYDIHCAEGVTDEMSFADAFAAARDEVGAGGVFIWRGGVYGTYYGDEWDELSPEMQTEWSDEALSRNYHQAAYSQANTVEAKEISGEFPAEDVRDITDELLAEEDNHSESAEDESSASGSSTDEDDDFSTDDDDIDYPSDDDDYYFESGTDDDNSFADDFSDPVF